jgi:type II secretory pathway component GspD/PulD (secretin)
MRFSRVIFAAALLFASLLPAAEPVPGEPQERMEYLKFSDITLGSLFDYLSERSGTNIVIEPQLREYRTSLRLKEVSLEEVIGVVAEKFHLAWTKNDRGYTIQTRRKLHEENYYQQNFRKRSVRVNYAPLTEAVKLLKDLMHGTAVVRSSGSGKSYANLFDATPDLAAPEGQDSGGSSQSGDAIFPEQSGSESSVGGSAMRGAGGQGGSFAQQEALPGRMLYIVPYFDENLIYLLSADEGLIDEAEAYIAEIDKPLKEVLIQGKIIEIGIDDGFTSFFDFSRRSSSLEASYEMPASVVSVGNLQYTFLDSLTNLSIEMLQNEGKAKTIASPMLLTANRTAATLDLVREVSIIRGWTPGETTQVEGTAVTRQPSPVYSSERIGTEFKIVPYINSEDEILLKITIGISTLQPGSQQILVPTADGGYDAKQLDGVSETKIETTLVTKNGRGIVLGGLISESVSKQESKVPILGDIPILGFPFKDIQDVTEKKETVVILTPVITDMRRPDSQGTYEKLRENIEKERRIMGKTEAEPIENKLVNNLLGKHFAEEPEAPLRSNDEVKIEQFLKEQR